VAELEEVGERRRDEQPVVERTLDLDPDLREPFRLGDRDELRRRALEPGEQVADLRHGQALEGGVRP
jgi:hypothetical protein